MMSRRSARRRCWSPRARWGTFLPSAVSARSDRRDVDTFASFQKLPSKWLATIAPQERPIKKWLDVRPLTSRCSMSTSVNCLDLTMCSVSSSRVWKNSLRGLLSLSVAANAVLKDHTKCFQAPPLFGAPRGINLQDIVRMSASFFVFSCTSRIFVSSLLALTKFVPLSK
ncbi:hypothetical protein EVAR_84639_1 [Eumeta japonica]|uniref:Uncharacterized protein n=1 Tax=Eumeta variegata TaxID=151549 RepID=A0A4C1UZT8_EUMVA|nr:hypothetical protein EVAR_84639_1 [Eumeta japonica]